VHCVDWCDAQAYCTWARKYLCGGPRGATLTSEASLVDDTVSQWFRACSAGGTRRYPYGPDHVTDACNDDTASPVLTPVGTFTACEGGVAGLRDMVGNVAEWTNAYLPSVASAAAQGGGIADLYADCSRVERLPIQRTYPSVGFRCCSD
jgi:formylglycine-generating enzyme